MLPVGRIPVGACPYGVMDMAGNAAKWVADYFEFNYYFSRFVSLGQTK